MQLSAFSHGAAPPPCLQVIVTCEKIWWLVQQGQQYLKPETRPAGTMVSCACCAQMLCVEVVAATCCLACVRPAQLVSWCAVHGWLQAVSP